MGWEPAGGVVAGVGGQVVGVGGKVVGDGEDKGMKVYMRSRYAPTVSSETLTDLKEGGCVTPVTQQDLTEDGDRDGDGDFVLPETLPDLIEDGDRDGDEDRVSPETLPNLPRDGDHDEDVDRNLQNFAIAITRTHRRSSHPSPSPSSSTVEDMRPRSQNPLAQ
ncbi:hypothetical protein TIFTF001_028737 [Ficus carica]|uniref:Uncharacterized protein n=1 Tax=Ficus carica TaxID=3494 RepID=A0AA88DQH1_FICCA|nr:hypothetical protein TIFTF001_028737 [Ficus carica]